MDIDLHYLNGSFYTSLDQEVYFSLPPDIESRFYKTFKDLKNQTKPFHFTVKGNLIGTFIQVDVNYNLSLLLLLMGVENTNT